MVTKAVWLLYVTAVNSVSIPHFIPCDQLRKTHCSNTMFEYEVPSVGGINIFWNYKIIDVFSMYVLAFTIIKANYMMVCTSCKNSYNVLSLSGDWAAGKGGGGVDAKERVSRF